VTTKTTAHYGNVVHGRLRHCSICWHCDNLQSTTMPTCCL